MIKEGMFPTLTERDRVATLRDYRSLYDGHHFAVLKLHDLIKKQYSKKEDIVYLAHNLPAYISDFFGDFVAGDTEKLVIRGNVDDQKVNIFVDETVFENDLVEKIADIGTEQSEFGFVVLLGWLDTSSTYHIDLVGQDQYFPQPDGSVVFATFKRVETMTQKDIFAFIQEYSVVGKDCVINRSVWKTDEQGIIAKKLNYPVGLGIFGRKVEDYKEVETIVGLGDLPIRQIDNTKRTQWGFGKSDYNDIMPQFAEINERSTHITTQLLQNLDAKLMLPKGMANEDGKIEPYDTILMESKDTPEAKFVTNNNPLIDAAERQIMAQTKVVSLVSAVPLWELLKTGMPERVESLRIQLFSSIRRANRKRAKIKRALNDMFRIGFKMKGINFDDDIDIRFSDVLPTDELIQATTEQTKVQSGLSSKTRAIMRLENVDEEEAKEELEQVAEEDKIAGIDVKKPPQL